MMKSTLNDQIANKIFKNFIGEVIFLIIWARTDFPYVYVIFLFMNLTLKARIRFHIQH